MNIDKIKILLLFTIILISSCGTHKSLTDNQVPKKFKVGKFIYGKGSEGFIIKKTLNMQTEYNPTTNYRIDFKLNWKSQNEYDMIFLGGNKGCLKIGDTINVKIVSWDDDSYIYEAFDHRCLGNSKGEIVKI